MINLRSCGAGLLDAAIISAAWLAEGLENSVKLRDISAILSAVSLPRRSATCATYRLTGRTDELASRQMPLPSNSPQQPKAQFCAPGGFSQEIFEASHCQRTELAADQPAPSPSSPRFIKLRPFPSIRTLSNSVPLDQD